VSRLLPGSDGDVARRAGEYAREKLAFLEAFMAPALTIAGSMPDRTFLDLFAGPGLNKVEETGAEFTGSPLLALEAAATAKHQRGFTDAHFVNLEPACHGALRHRVDRLVARGASRIPPSRIRLHRGDTNAMLPDLMGGLPKAGYILAFADITGVKHWPWESVQQLRAQGHRAVDLYVLFPLEMTIERLLGTNRARSKIYAGHLDRFFGSTEWRTHYDERISSAQGAAFRTALIEHYRQRLLTIWGHAVVACAPGFSEDRALYRMFFATSNDAAIRAASWAKSRPPGGQMQLPF